MRLALHACCGSCLIEPLDEYRARFGDACVIYANPNIHPLEEYERRRSVLLAYAQQQDVAVLEVAYQPEVWMERVGPLAETGAERCRACYALRLGLAAQCAAENGFEALATTLTVSPYQDPELIRIEGERACGEAGIAYVHEDFRQRYPRATRRSREIGMYRQNYCGCIFSEDEARRARDERRASRHTAPGGG
ncbi:MAG: epoxyqueuosine reductase QueH [Coriobacteriia bacterium]|nr:epoxyqueuosine reductase QueH [Coriobacteriia bacterium]